MSDDVKLPKGFEPSTRPISDKRLALMEGEDITVSGGAHSRFTVTAGEYTLAKMARDAADAYTRWRDGCRVVTDYAVEPSGHRAQADVNRDNFQAVERAMDAYAKAREMAAITHIFVGHVHRPNGE